MVRVRAATLVGHPRTNHQSVMELRKRHLVGLAISAFFWLENSISRKQRSRIAETLGAEDEMLLIGPIAFPTCMQPSASSIAKDAHRRRGCRPAAFVVVMYWPL